MGKIAQFKYNGGSHPGKARLVYMFEDNIQLASRVAVKGYDFELDEIRTFTPAKMQDYVYMPIANFINIEALPSSVDAHDIVSGYRADGKLAYYDSNKNIVVATEKPAKPPGFSVYPSFTLVNDITKYTIGVFRQNDKINIQVTDSNGFGFVNQQLSSLSELADIIKRYA